LVAETSTARGESRWRYALVWLLLAVGFAVAYAHTFSEMWQRWFPAWRRTNLGLYDRLMEGESYYTHGPLVPLVSLLTAVILIRHTRVPCRGRPVLGGLVLGASLLLHLTACFARVNFVSAFSLIGVLAGLVLMLWGAFLAFMVPLPEVSIAQLNFRLKMWAAEAGVWLANLLGVLAERSGNQVFLEGGKHLVIANVCNGLRTLISLVAFGAMYAYVCKLRGIWRIILFGLSVPVAVVSNSVRIVALILVAHVWDAETATGLFHDVSGLMIYALAFGLMFGLEHLILALHAWVGRPVPVRPLFDGIRRDPDDDRQWPRLVRAAGGVAGWVAVVLVGGSAAGAVWLARATPPVWTGQVARKALPERLRVDGQTLVGYDMEMDERTLTILETRDYLLRRYVRPGSPPVDFCMVFSEDNRKGTHPPDLCLEGGGQDIVAKADLLVEVGDGLDPIPCRELLVQDGARRTYFIYTYRCGDAYTASFWRQQMTIFLNGLLSRNASGALIRVSTPVERNLGEARRRSVRLLRAAVPLLNRNLP